MNCETAHELLQLSLDGSPLDSPAWSEHLRTCPQCRALATASRRLQEGLRHAPAPTPPPDLAARIVAGVLRDRRQMRRRARRRLVGTLALAAGLFVVVGFRLDWGGVRKLHDADSETVVATRANVPEKPDAPTLRESATELKDAFAALTNQTADETVDRTRRLVAHVPSPTLPVVDLKTMGPPTRPLREAGEGVSEGLEPVTNSARRAVGLFLRELPPMDDGPKGL